MELQKKYWINIISQINNESNGSFLVVERLNSDSSLYFQNYYKSLLRFNSCGDWFQNLDYPNVQIGMIVLVQINKNTNLWARGIISKLNADHCLPEVYLIDSQRFVENYCKFQLRVCPPKFARLILPTYNIDVNLCLNDSNLKSAIQMLIKKNQHGDLSFHFIPKSVKNNVYSGELIVNNTIDNSFISLKKLLKNFHTKKYFEDISNFKKNTRIVFNPLELKLLQTILIPRDPSIVFLETNSHYSDINYSNYVPENLLYESQDEYSSVLDSDFSFSDDSILEIKKTQNDFIVPITKQKVYSSFSSSINTSNSSLYSYSLEEEKNSSPLSTVQNILNESLNQNTKQMESVILEIVTTNCKDQKSNYVNINEPTNNVSTSCFESITNDIKNTKSQIKQCSIADQKIEIDTSNEKHLINMPVKKLFNSVSKYKDTECQQNINLNMVHEALETPKINSNLINDNNKVIDDDFIWWSSDDE